MINNTDVFGQMTTGNRNSLSIVGIPVDNSTKTELVMTANLREWRHFFKLRTNPAAHPQMIEVAKMLLEDAKQRIPIVFDEY